MKIVKEDIEWERGRIYERNPITNKIKSRKLGEYGNERIEISFPLKKRLLITYK